MDFQQPHGYMRPPPPPPPPSMAADPYYHHQTQIPPVPPPNPWYSTQFQFQHASSPPQPPPPPPPAHVQPQLHQPWAPPPQHSDQFVPPHYPYPTPPPPYPAPPNQYPHPPPHPHASLPPRPPHMSVASPHISQSYPQVHQEWGPANWGHHQNWEYQANNNEEVWAAKARAWAASKVASDDQQSQHPAYAFKDGSMAGDSAAAFAGRDSSISPSVHQQEVPSSYSSIAGEPVRSIEHAAAVPSDYSFVPPAEPALVYPSVPVMLPAGPQVDPAVTVPSPVPGHTASIFGRIPAPSFQPTVSSVAAPFGIGAGPELHPGTPFSADSFGVPIASERPKKASVPNWLREEIIKNKPSIVSSAAELQKEDVDSIEDDSGKGDQKSVDSPRSTEDEDDDEDELEVARMAAINHEIKRIVTDVLLQVTDELFDEIATKVLSEDDPTIEVDNGVSIPDREVPTSAPTIANAKANSMVPLPLKSKETVSNDASEKFDSSPGDVLGLASYASDEDDSELESSDKTSFKEKNSQQQSTSGKLSKGKDVEDNGGLKGEANKIVDNLESDLCSSRQNAPTVNHNAAITELKAEGAAKTSNVESGVAESGMLHHADTSKFNNNLGARDAGNCEQQVENHISRKSIVDGSLSEGIRDKLDKNDRHEQERNFAGKNYNVNELEISKESVPERREVIHSRHDERHIKKERGHDKNGSKERGREKVIKLADRAKDSDSRKRLSPDYVRDGRRERQTDSRAGVKEENDGKRERTKDDKREKPRDRNSNDSSSRHNRHHASSVSSRDRDYKDGGRASDSSDESSDDTKLKLPSRRQKSPSPVRSRKRHVSRSPHSKHSQRRHSPYSSLETSRRKKSRSRSRSPIRRKR